MTSHDEKALQIFFIKIPEEKAEESAYNIPLSSPQGVNGMWKKTVLRSRSQVKWTGLNDY